MTFLTNLVYGASATAAITAGFLVYKKRMSIAWYLTSGYSNIKFYSSPIQENKVRLLQVRNAVTLQPLLLQEGYEEYTEVSYLWNNNKYTVIYEPYKKILFPPYDEEKMLSTFVPDYEFYIRTSDSVTKIENIATYNRLKEIMGPLCDFYEHCHGVISPRKCLLNYKIINANQTLLVYDILIGEEKEF
jgi:hypothetical protein